MSSQNSFLKLLARVLLFACLLLPTFANAWELIRKGDRDYLSTRELRSFYGFQTARSEGDSLFLENQAFSLQLTKNRQEILMNRVKFVLSHPVLEDGEHYLVSRVDLVKLIDPVLRPKYIKTAKPFRTVILDPGHGGNDSGATNHFGTEKFYNLKLAKILKPILEARGFNVVLTRQDDTFLTLQQRVDFANRYKDAIFVSLHFNAGPRDARGIETFTLSPAGTSSTYGRLKRSDANSLEGNSQDSANIALATAIHGLMQRRLGTEDRGIKRARYSVLTGITHPAILIEGGFMTHSYEAKMIHSENYINRLAGAVSDGILKYRVAVTKR